MSRALSKKNLAEIMACPENGTLKLSPPPPKRKNEEMRMQIEFVSWWHHACAGFQVPEFLLWHTPNGSVYGGSKEDRARIGALMKKQGCRDGIPDLFLAVPRLQIVSKGLSGLFIEMKAPNGVLSPAQKIVLPELEAQGYAASVCWTVEDAINVTTNYLTK